MTAVVEKLRAKMLFEERFVTNVRRVDTLFSYLMAGQWVFALVIALVYSPRAWAQKTVPASSHALVAFVVGALLSGPTIALVRIRPAWVGTRMTIVVAQMAWSALLIHLSGGRIEAHFHVFGSLAILAFYRDWRVFVPATLVVLADNLLRQLLWPESVYGVPSPEPWRFVEHVGWVAFEVVFLTLACLASVREMKLAAAQQTHIEVSQRRERELEIAARIQTSILPRQLRVDGLEIAARMLPATEVGGDYYDVIPVAGGCWIGIGDVAGHGLRAGLVMLQAQSAIQALVRRTPDAPPCEILSSANEVLFENVRMRLDSDEHVTMSLMRWRRDGRVDFTGAHEEIVVWRKETRRCERIPVEGTWLGAVADIREHTRDRTLHLGPGDLLVLHTDGITEARNKEKKQFGLDALVKLVEAHPEEAVETIRDLVFHTVAQWHGGKQDDDVTLVVIRQSGS